MHRIIYDKRFSKNLILELKNSMGYFYSIMNEALIIIDLQKDFCPGGSLAVEKGDTIVPVVNTASSAFSQVIATKDWHPAGHVSFASSHQGRNPLDTLSLGNIEQVLWPDHCVAGTKGADFHPDLDLKPLTLILHKGTKKNLDSYSAFFENDRKTSTGLAGYLKDLRIRELYLSGLATDYCVFYTVMDALALGFSVKVIKEAVYGVGFPEGSIERAVKTMEEGGARFISIKEITK